MENFTTLFFSKSANGSPKSFQNIVFFQQIRPWETEWLSDQIAVHKSAHGCLKSFQNKLFFRKSAPGNPKLSKQIVFQQIRTGRLKWFQNKLLFQQICPCEAELLSTQIVFQQICPWEHEEVSNKLFPLHEIKLFTKKKLLAKDPCLAKEHTSNLPFCSGKRAIGQVYSIVSWASLPPIVPSWRW